MSLEKVPPYCLSPGRFEQSGSFVCRAIALKLSRSGNYLPALLCVNQAIELAGDNKRRDYFPMLAPLKIDLQIKLQLFNEARQTVRLLAESMTDSGHANRLLRDYHAILTEPALEVSTNTDGLESYLHFIACVWQIIPPLHSGRKEEEENLIELDQNCVISTSALQGRHMRCSGTIPYGTYLLREKVLSLVYYSPFLANRCSTCHRSVGHCFHPCRACNQVLFCSAKCEQRSYDGGIHRYECGLIDFVKHNSVVWHAFRLVCVLGLQSVAQFYRDKARHQAQKTEFSVEDYLKEHRLCKQPFEAMSREDQLRAFALIDSFVDHRGDGDCVAEQETLRWAVKVVLLINQQQRE